MLAPLGALLVVIGGITYLTYRSGGFSSHTPHGPPHGPIGPVGPGGHHGHRPRPPAVRGPGMVNAQPLPPVVPWMDPGMPVPTQQAVWNALYYERNPYALRALGDHMHQRGHRRAGEALHQHAGQVEQHRQHYGYST